MSTRNLPRLHALLNTQRLDDARRAKLLTGIQEVAPQSLLIQDPGIAASVAALAAKGAQLAADVEAVAGNRQLLVTSISARDASRLAFDLELVSLKTQVENHATTGSDLTAMGFVLASGQRASRARPDPPVALVVKIGRARGKARVAVQETGTRKHYTAEMSFDPVGPATWQALPGNGKERILSGYETGTKIWVRFATVLWGQQSDWCVPVLVTIP